MKRGLSIAGLIAGTLLVDQLSKVWARGALQGHPPTEYLGGLLRIQFAFNSGAFLSLGAGMSDSARFGVFTVAVGLFLIGAIAYLVRRPQLDRFTTIGLSLLIGGGIGNLIDRIAAGHVTDFLNMGWGSLRTGIFNVADMAVVLGVVLLFFAPSKRATA